VPLAGLLVAATLIVYVPALRAGFIWDDDAHVTENPTLTSLAGLRAIWLDPTALPQYYPLVHSTFWVERHLWGLDPLGYHLSNVLLHAANALLLWTVLEALSVPGAWLAAFLFALHPVHVESVAWVTERKNVLSGFFYLAAAFCCLRFYGLHRSAARAQDDRSTRDWRWYAFGAALFLCALLSKTVTASLPVALLIVLWWKRGRIAWRDVAPLIPLVVVGACFGLLTVWLEKHHVGVQGDPWDLTPLGRCLLAGRILWFYAGKLAWPAQLLFVYPRWRVDPSQGWTYLFPLGAAAVVAGALALRRRIGRGPLAAILFFAVTLVPALGFFNVFPMVYSWVADHFQYLASAGPIALFAAAVATAAARLSRGPGRAVVATAALAPVFLGALTWHQCHIYKDAETLWRDTLARNPSAWMAHSNLGSILYVRGDDAQAAPHLRQALDVIPLHANSHFTLARALMNLGRLDEAAALCREELTVWPSDERTLENLGLVALLRGDKETAAKWFYETIRLHPDSATAHANLADILAAQGRVKEASEQSAEVARIVAATGIGQAR
jgi:tetratricopeptide (TPR) repeat protein